MHCTQLSDVSEIILLCLLPVTTDAAALFESQESRGGYTMVRNDEHSLISILLFLYLDKQDAFLFFNLEVFINSAFYLNAC